MPSLRNTQPELAARIQKYAAERFMSVADLDSEYLQAAIERTDIFVGSNEDGSSYIHVQWPSGLDTGWETWDGTFEEAKTYVDSSIEGVVDDLRWDQEHVGPTGWERS